MSTTAPGGFDPAKAPPATTPIAEPDPHRPPDDSEQVYYEGSPKTRGTLGRVIEFGVIGLVFIAMPIIVRVVRDSFMPWWLNIFFIVIGLLLLFVPVLRTKTIRYRITNYRIDYERGLLSRNIDTLELWHVEDISFHQSLIDRMLNVGTITVVSRDETMPRLILHGLPNPRPLYETLKQRVISVKRQRGVVKMDPG
jgi:hypothetical protein